MVGARLYSIHAAMTSSNMELLTEDRYQDALSCDFNVNLNIELKNGALDNSFISRLHMYAYSCAPPQTRQETTDRYQMMDVTYLWSNPRNHAPLHASPGHAHCLACVLLDHLRYCMRIGWHVCCWII